MSENTRRLPDAMKIIHRMSIEELRSKNFTPMMKNMTIGEKDSFLYAITLRLTGGDINHYANLFLNNGSWIHIIDMPPSDERTEDLKDIYKAFSRILLSNRLSSENKARVTEAFHRVKEALSSPVIGRATRRRKTRKTRRSRH